jgi:hypothetical protein
MRPREDETALSPEVERELEALEAALAGGRVDPDLDDIARLARELRAERPEPSFEFTAALDDRAAGSFAATPRARWARNRGRLLPALAAAATVVITGAAVTSTGVLERDGLEDAGAPALQTQPGGAEVGAPDAGRTQTGEAATSRALKGAPAEPASPAARKVARTASLGLSTAPDEVRDVADGVVEVTHRHRGFVVSSTVSSGDGGAAHGDFALKLPARNLQAALGELSELAHVSSLTEGTDDITKRFVSARERIGELRARREKLRDDLAAAETPREEQAIRVELRQVRDALQAVRADLAQASERVRLVPVQVSVTADGEEAGGGWSVRDALDDALRVLEVAVGVALVALAALVPLAVIAALGWAASRTWVRRQRERSLDEGPRPAA